MNSKVLSRYVAPCLLVFLTIAAVALTRAGQPARPGPDGAATVTPSPTPTPHLELNGQGTITGPGGGQASFTLSDIEMDMVTAKYFEGKMTFHDNQAGVGVNSQRITSVTISPDRTSATFSGQKNDLSLTYTVTVTANQHPQSGDSFTISTSTGYSASGNLTSGAIGISVAP